MFKRNKVKGDSDFQVYIFVQILRHSLNKKMVWKGLICVCHHYEAEGYVETVLSKNKRLEDEIVKRQLIQRW